jgi:serine/threonine protein kinase
VGTPNGSSLLGEGGFGQVFKAIHFPTMRYQGNVDTWGGLGQIGVRFIHALFSGYSIQSTHLAIAFVSPFPSLYPSLHLPAHLTRCISFGVGRRVAIKKIAKDFGDSMEYANSFARELRNLYKNVRTT